MDPRSLEFWEMITWQPREVLDLRGGRYLVLIEASGRGRRSGILLAREAAGIG